MTRLSVNINKVALLRNARGANIPDLIQFAVDCERYGAQGITVHPRPDERHIRKSDVYALKEVVQTEFNIEGNPTEDFLKMVFEVSPHQCTLVPDEPGQLTSDHGWDTQKYFSLLEAVIGRLKSKGIRVSLFIDPIKEKIEGAAKVGADRIEFYTGPYAYQYPANREEVVKDFFSAAELCRELSLGINAGHDLNLDNLRYFKQQVKGLQEVSIGQALIKDCLYLGLENTIQLYLRELED